MKKNIIALGLLVLSVPVLGYADLPDSDAQFYRNFTLKIRPKGTFKVPMPGNGDMVFKYEFKLSTPLWALPMTGKASKCC